MKPILLNALLVGSAGFLGAVSRYAVGGAVHRVFPQATFPVGTLSVNLLGCFLVGALAGLADSRHLFTPELRAFVFIGLLGGFTTFSTFGYETVTLARGGEALRAVANVGAHVVVGLTLVWFGYGLASSR